MAYKSYGIARRWSSHSSDAGGSGPESEQFQSKGKGATRRTGGAVSHLQQNMEARTRTHIHTDTQTHRHTHTHTRTHAHTYTHTHTRIHARIRTHSHTHTQMHTRPHERRACDAITFMGQSPQRSPIISGSFAQRDQQLKTSYESLPPCTGWLSVFPPHTHTHMHTHTYANTHIRTHTHARTHARTRTCTHTRI